MTTKKRHPDLLRENEILNKAKRKVPGFEELLARFERTVSVLGRSRVVFAKKPFLPKCPCCRTSYSDF